MNEQWHFAIDADGLEEEDVTMAMINDLAIAVYRVKGQFYATDDTCTHGGASMSEGVVLGDIIECPLHQGRFCIRSGQPKGGPVSVALRTYPTKVEGRRVLVQVATADAAPTPEGRTKCA